MKILKEGLELAIKHYACKGNREAFEKALENGNKLECYQIAFGNRYWLLERGIIKYSDLSELEKLAQGVGKTYYNNGQLYFRAHYKNGELHGIFENWYPNGQPILRANYENGKNVSSEKGELK